MRTLLFLSVIIPVCLFAQVSDDFSDGDFTQSPAWMGDISHFKLSSSSAVPENQRPALQLNAPASGTSSLAVMNHFSGELEWTFWVKLSLNTSSGNYARVYLLSDNVDLKTSLEGYFLQIGGIEDSVIFFRQDSLEETRLFRLNSVFTGNSVNTMRFRISRDSDGNWKFYADTLGGQSLEFQGEVNDPAIPGGDYFGLYCKYSSSNITKFYFDDFYAGPLIIDSIPPSLAETAVISPSEISLIFSEPVDQESAEDTAHFSINPDLGMPYEAVRLLDPSVVELFFDREMQSGITYSLNISSVKDLAGNETGTLTQAVWYYIVRPYDVVFTEIMADPSPPAGLPEYEYLEILNRSQFPIDLTGWNLAVSSNMYELPIFTFDPGEYLLICSNDAAAAMQYYGSVLSLESMVLPNNGAVLHLRDTAGNTVCCDQYDLSWYKDDIKSGGGWSLEMINPSDPCKNEENWAASVHPSGGTPGRENSLSGQDNGMKIIKICSTGERQIEVFFNESLDSLIASEPVHYLAEPQLGNPGLACPVSPGFNSVILQFDQQISTGQVYRLNVNAALKNCIGELIAAGLSADFAVPEPVSPSDIVINEVLFNPRGDGVDYVELYNRSGKVIELDELSLASVRTSPPEPRDTQFVSISSSCAVLLPDRYLVLTSDPQTVKNQYYTSDPEAFLELPSFPSYNNDSGRVLLLGLDKSLIDGMSYSADMHFQMLNSFEGVSLEKICPDKPGDDLSNWHSAAETAGFGTPGYRNSQYLAINYDDETAFSLQPEVFSPDGDGKEDNLGIAYHFDSPGKLMTVLIFNAEGRPVRRLVNNEMPGVSGISTWDGNMDDRTMAPNGIYIVYAEILAMDGKTRHYKKACVLARQR